MLDTLGIKQYFPILPNDDFKNTFQSLSRLRNPTWTLNAKGAKTLPNLTITKTPDEIYHLLAQVSLPKFLFGHNSRLPNQSEVNHGLALMAEYIAEKSGLPFDLDNALVYLVHFALDIQLSEPEIRQVIEKMSKKHLKPLRKQLFEDSTLYFTDKAKKRKEQIRIYSKLPEVLSRKKPLPEAVRDADGKLRFEYCLLLKPAIDALVSKLGLPDRKAKTLLTENVSDSIMSELLDNLNFFELLSGEKTDLQILLEQFPTKQSMYLLGFKEFLKENGSDCYKDKRLGISKSVYFRNLRDLRKAKVW